MISFDACRGSLNPTRLFKWIKYKLGFAREHPEYFYPDGLSIFVGPQGSGKTLSAVNYVYKLMEYYPNALLVTNIELREYPFD